MVVYVKKTRTINEQCWMKFLDLRIREDNVPLDFETPLVEHTKGKTTFQWSMVSTIAASEIDS